MNYFVKVLRFAQKMPADKAIRYRNAVDRIFRANVEPDARSMQEVHSLLKDSGVDSAPVFQHIRDHFAQRHRNFLTCQSV